MVQGASSGCAHGGGGSESFGLHRPVQAQEALIAGSTSGARRWRNVTRSSAQSAGGTGEGEVEQAARIHATRSTRMASWDACGGRFLQARQASKNLAPRAPIRSMTAWVVLVARSRRGPERVRA